MLKRLQPYGFSLAIVMAMTMVLWLLRGYLTLANFTTLFLLAVLVIAIWQGTRPALVSAFLSFISINFFLVRPLYTLTVANPQELLDLVVFFGVALVAGRLAAQAQLQAEDARQRAFEQELLYRLTRDLNQSTTAGEVYTILADTLSEDLHAQQVQILPEAAGAIADAEAVYYVLLQAGDTVHGTLCTTFANRLSAGQHQLLNACAAQAALALHRIDLTQRALRTLQLEEADKLKTAILRALSHDLRTPITVIKTSASNLRQLFHQLAPEQQQEIAATIETETDILDSLVGNLLDLSRLQAGAVQLNCALNSLEELAGDAAAQVWQRTGKERARLVFPDDMPLVAFDYGLALQALTNLVENALRYEPAESQIELRGLATGAEARLAVVNHGPDLTAEERARITEPFFHGKQGKTGLGLAIAKGIIEAHHGRLQIDTTPGGGVTFVIVLPLKREEEQRDEAENPGGR